MLRRSPLRRLCRAATFPLRYARAQLRWWGVTLAAVAACAALPPPPAAAQDSEALEPFCDAPRELLLAALAAEMDERLVVSMIGPDGSLVELTASASGAWSLVTTQPGGPTCLEGGGEGFRLWPLAARS